MILSKEQIQQSARYGKNIYCNTKTWKNDTTIKIMQFLKNSNMMKEFINKKVTKEGFFYMFAMEYGGFLTQELRKENIYELMKNISVNSIKASGFKKFDNDDINNCTTIMIRQISSESTKIAYDFIKKEKFINNILKNENNIITKEIINEITMHYNSTKM